MNRLDLYKKYLKIDYDEQIFYTGCADFKMEPEIDFRAINDANKALPRYDKHINNLERDLKNLEENKDLLRSVSDISSEVSDIASGFLASEKAIENLQNWGSNWSSIAMTLFRHMLENHADELDALGICQYEINENELKSAEGIDKFNL